jgi:DNA-binding XRE family transcriptional regulator
VTLPALDILAQTFVLRFNTLERYRGRAQSRTEQEERMKKLRKQRRMVGLSQFALAKLTGIAPGRIVFAETGRVTLKPEEIERIKFALARRAEQVNAALAAA